MMATMMMTMTRAAKAGTNLTLSVVPPQDAVEERFQKQYLITIGLAAVIVRHLGLI